MTIIRDAVRAIKTMSGRWMYVDERDLYVCCLDFAADYPRWDGSLLDDKGRIIEPAPVVAEVEAPEYEPTTEELAWLDSLEAIQPWHRESPVFDPEDPDYDAWLDLLDRERTMELLAIEAERMADCDDPAIGGCGGHDLD